MQCELSYEYFARAVTGQNYLPVQVKWDTRKLGLKREFKFVEANDLPFEDLDKVRSDYAHLEIDGWEIVGTDSGGIKLVRFVDGSQNLTQAVE